MPTHIIPFPASKSGGVIEVEITTNMILNPDPVEPEPPTPDPDPEVPGERNNLVYQDDFESANPLVPYEAERQWLSADSITISKGIVRSGKQALKFVQFGQSRNGKDQTVSGGYRTEIKSEAFSKGLGNEHWLGISTYFENWSAANVGEHIHQYHPSNSSGSAVLAIYTNNNTFHVRLNPEGDSSAFTLKDGMKIPSNKWVDFVWHIIWSNDATKGLIEMWIDGIKYVDYKGVTLKMSSLPYWKCGVNRWLTGSNVRTFYVDALRIGSNFASYKDVAP